MNKENDQSEDVSQGLLEIPDESPDICNKESKKMMPVLVDQSKIKIGDHICWVCGQDKTIFNTTYWRHALITEIDACAIVVIGWKFRPDSRTNTYSPEIVQNDINFTDLKDLHKAHYDERNCYAKEKAVERAQQHLGDTDYHWAYNYARALPRYCKTGYGGRTFIDPENREPIMVKVEIKDLKKGDHVKYGWFPKKNAIVAGEWTSEGTITIISHPGQQIKEKFLGSDNVHKAIYSNFIRSRFPLIEVLMRATGENKHKVKDFPRWCATGYGEKPTEK